MKQASRFLAHVRRSDDGSFVIHQLEEHLEAVGDLAEYVMWTSSVGQCTFATLVPEVEK
ncbi:MAG: hypothetical protein P0121_01440 [Nitrospira sp.]|nr:hypothetical protein [Nitrospira sp.]